MTPTKHDITIWRGTSFELELISQIKQFAFDPTAGGYVATAGDLKRTHAENLEYYGWAYAYIDFSATYTAATLNFKKPWIKPGQAASTPLLTLTAAGGGLVLGTQSVKIVMASADTKAIDFDTASYELLLSTGTGQIDELVYGDVIVLGDK